MRALVLVVAVISVVGQGFADEMIAGDKRETSVERAGRHLEFYLNRLAQLQLKGEKEQPTVSIVRGGLWGRWQGRELRAQQAVFWQTELTRQDKKWFRLEAYVEGNVLLIIGNTAIRSQTRFLAWESDYRPIIHSKTKEELQSEGIPSIPLYQRALKARRDLKRKEKGQKGEGSAREPAGSNATRAPAPSSQIPPKVRVTSRHRMGFNLKSWEVEGVRISVCSGGVEVALGDSQVRADNIVLWQPVAAEKKTRVPPSIYRSMARVT